MMNAIQDETNGTQDNTPKVLARVAAGRGLTIAAGNTSEALDRFAVWMLVAFGAGLALVLSHIADVQRYIPIGSIRGFTRLFVAAAIVCVFERYIAVVISGGAKTALESAAIGEKYRQMDIEHFISETERGVPFIARPFAAKAIRAAREGDFAANGRRLTNLAVWQGCLVLIEAILLIAALIKLLSGITG